MAIVAAESRFIHQFVQGAERRQRGCVVEDTARKLFVDGDVVFGRTRENLRSERLVITGFVRSGEDVWAGVYELSVPLRVKTLFGRVERWKRVTAYLVLTPDAFIFCREREEWNGNIGGSFLTFQSLSNNPGFLLNVLTELTSYRDKCVTRRRIMCGLGILTASFYLAGANKACGDLETPILYEHVSICDIQGYYDFRKEYFLENETDVLDDPRVFTKRFPGIIVTQGSNLAFSFDKYSENQCRFWIPINNVYHQNDGKVRITMTINESAGKVSRVIDIIRGEGERITAVPFTHSQLDRGTFLLFCWYLNGEIHFAMFYLEGE